MDKQLINTFTNDVILSGTLTSLSDCKTSRDGHIYHIAKIKVMRLSATCDNIALVIPHSLTRGVNNHDRIKIEGKLCASYNKDAPRHCKTRIWVKVNDLVNLNDTEDFEDINSVTLTTAFHDIPTIRHTPQGKLIADAFVYIRPRTYIPAIAWGQTAIQLSHTPVTVPPTLITLQARLQSREYECLSDNGEIETYETVEVCMQKIVKEETNDAEN